MMDSTLTRFSPPKARRAIVSLALAVVAPLVLASCGDDEEAAKKQAEPTAEVPSFEQAPAPEPEPEPTPEPTARIVPPPPPKPAIDATWDGEPKRLTLYAWADYIAPEVLAGFTKATGIKVTYKTFESRKALRAALAKDTDVDVLVPPAGMLGEIGADAFRRLMLKRLPNRDNLDPFLTDKLRAVDPKRPHAIPYFWGTAGVAYHVKTVRKRLGPRAPLDGWALVFDTKWAERLGDCGLYFPAVPDEVMDLGLISLGLRPDTEDEADYAKLEAMLMKLRPFITGFHDNGMIDQLVAGEACAVVGWSTHLMAAHSMSADDTGAFQVDYSVPVEGTLLWSDLLAIPTGAAHPGNAHRFINYMMKPDAAAANTDYIWYASGNAAAKAKIDPVIADNPRLYPPRQILDKSWFHKPLSKKAKALRTALWDKFSKPPE